MDSGRMRDDWLERVTLNMNINNYAVTPVPVHQS